jgi:hypothetical protein
MFPDPPLLHLYREKVPQKIVAMRGIVTSMDVTQFVKS